MSGSSTFVPVGAVGPFPQCKCPCKCTGEAKTKSDEGICKKCTEREECLNLLYCEHVFLEALENDEVFFVPVSQIQCSAPQ